LRYWGSIDLSGIGRINEAARELYSLGSDVSRVQTQKLFYFQLNGKTMGIPSGFTRNHISFHGAITGDHILNDTGLHMSDMRLSVCSRRSVIECVGLSFFSAVDTLLENIMLFPECAGLLLTIYEIQITVYFLINSCHVLLLKNWVKKTSSSNRTR